MEVLLVFAGIAFGWLLGAGWQAWRERREGRFAAWLILSELIGNTAQLEHAREPKRWTERRAFSQTAFDAYGPKVLRILRPEGALAVIAAYQAVRTTEAMLDNARDSLKNQQTQGGKHQPPEKPGASWQAQAEAGLRQKIDHALQLQESAKQALQVPVLGRPWERWRYWWKLPRGGRWPWGRSPRPS
jgi:hypothetical protein